MATAPKLPPQHKVGDTFTRLLPIPTAFPDGTPLPDGYFLGWAPTSQIRDKAGALIADAVCTWLEPVATTRNLSIRVADTTGWARWAGESVDIDVQFRRTVDGETMSTTTASFALVKDVTQAA